MGDIYLNAKAAEVLVEVLDFIIDDSGHESPVLTPTANTACNTSPHTPCWKHCGRCLWGRTRLHLCRTLTTIGGLTVISVAGILLAICVAFLVYMVMEDLR